MQNRRLIDNLLNLSSAGLILGPFMMSSNEILGENVNDVSAGTMLLSISLIILFRMVMYQRRTINELQMKLRNSFEEVGALNGLSSKNT